MVMTQITPAQVLTELQHHIGKENGIHVRELVQRITGQLAMSEALERKVRQIVTDLRMEGAHICGHPASGYFIAANPAELEETLQFLRSRSLTTLTLESRMRRVSMPDLLGQIHLPT
jgi:hypothetical protein